MLGPSNGLDRKKTVKTNKDLEKAPLQPQKSTQPIPLVKELITTKFIRLGLRKMPYQKTSNSLGDFHVND